VSFDIEVRYVDGTEPSAEWQQAFEEAVSIWESVVVGDLPAFHVNRPPELCELVSAPAMDESVDDLVVWVEIGLIDGPGGIGGWGGVCELRDNYLPAVGSVFLDAEDLTRMDRRVVVHELGHALGFGEVWAEMGLLIDPADPANGGPGFVRASADATISSNEPDQSFGIPNGSSISELIVVDNGTGVWTGGPPDEELRALIQFDVSGLSFAAPILSANLFVWDTVKVGENRYVYVDVLEESWDEATVTWNAQPANSGPFSAIYLPPDGCQTGCTVVSHSEIADLVRDWLSGQTSNNGLMLTVQLPGEADFGVAFHSRHDPNGSKRPALYIQPNTHFNGANAIAAFDAAGGATSTHPKVPVESDYLELGESVDGHWRSLWLDGDYMSPSGGSKMSAVTIGAMEDMGYEVDYSVADSIVIDPSRFE
jgi:hypothetical protein